MLWVLKTSQGDGSIEHQKQMNKLMGKKISTILRSIFFTCTHQDTRLAPAFNIGMSEKNLHICMSTP